MYKLSTSYFGNETQNACERRGESLAGAWGASEEQVPNRAMS
jgi:hypothetical protein